MELLVIGGGIVVGTRQQRVSLIQNRVIAWGDSGA